MQVADLNRKRKRRRNKSRTNGQRRTDNDPLQSYDGSNVNLDGVSGEEATLEEFFDAEQDEQDAKKQKSETSDKVFVNTKDGTGKSTSGRNAWKERHRKGKFSNKRRKSAPKRRKVGI
jgi:hypothetical protein